MAIELLRLYHTLRYLKPVQIYGRIRHRLHHPRPDLRPAPERAAIKGNWATPIAKPISLVKPNRFRFLNKEGTVEQEDDWNAAGQEKLWLYNLHYFDDLNGENAGERNKWHKDLITRWINENPPGKGNGWESYPLSLRIVNWIKWGLAGNEPDEKAIQSLAVQARYLEKRIEYHLLGNHLFANGKALVFAGLYFGGEEASRWYEKGLSILTAQVNEQVLADGGHFERSPMYHAIILEDMLDLINMHQAYQKVVPERWHETAGKMLQWLAVMSHPDGEIVLFNDAAFGIAPNYDKLLSYAGRLGLQKDELHLQKLTSLDATGYIRWQSEDAVAFFDLAPIGPDYLPGHAHADTLNFELSFFNIRVIVDSGTSCYGTSEERLRQRSTPAHNTVTINDKNSSEVWSGFRVARRAYPIGLKIEEHGDTILVSCGHDGYKRLPGSPEHHRHWQMGNNKIAITDSIAGPFENAVGRVYFHPGISLRLEKDGSVSGEIDQGKTFTVCVIGGDCKLSETTWHPEFGLSIANRCLEVAFTGPECTTVITW